MTLVEPNKIEDQIDDHLDRRFATRKWMNDYVVGNTKKLGVEETILNFTARVFGQK